MKALPVSLRTHAGQLTYGVLVHGGAGAIPSLRRKAHVEGCVEAAEAGASVLRQGGTASQAVVASARVLEDLPQYNAGTGASLNEDGDVEHDAALMDGSTLNVGAVAALQGFSNPIAIAERVLAEGRHVLLCADGARRFAVEHGFAPVDQASLITDIARAAWQRVKQHADPVGFAGGTIGAVARDQQGNLAAATSTGGTVNKRAGRIGDSPIVGAGTYADNLSAAVSATGIGEAILRMVLAHAVAVARAHGPSLQTAVSAELERLARRTAQTAGLIAIDRGGAWVASTLTETMSFALAGDVYHSGI